jgi:hypothetical protein
MFESILHPARRSLRELLMPTLLTLALLFCGGALWSFAAATGSAVSIAHAASPRSASAPGDVQCTTADGTIVLIGEIVAAADRR